MFLAHEFISDELSIVGLGASLEEAASALVRALRANSMNADADRIERGLDEVFITPLVDGGGAMGSDADVRFAFPDRAPAP